MSRQYTGEPTLKKPRLDLPDEAQPRNIQRADIAPANGFAMVVDGHFKTQFADAQDAQKACVELLTRYPMVRVEIYDAANKVRNLVRNEP
jgi:hypothetical protein